MRTPGFDILRWSARRPGSVFRSSAAARLCLAEAPALRAGDALHIALCQRQKSCPVSFDQSMCAAAAHHRVAVDLLRVGSS